MSESTPCDLAQLQQSMLTAVTHPNPANLDSLLSNEIAASSKLSAKAHLGIYQRSYILRLQQCMASQFPTLKYALGDELFSLFATQYLQSSPSNSYTLNNLGERLPQFLQQTRPDAHSEEKEDWPDFMIELAKFEIALNQLFDAESPLEINELKQIPASSHCLDEHLQLAPILQLFQLRYPIFSYYRLFNENQQPPLPLPATSYGAIFRQKYRIGVINLNMEQYQFLQHLQQTQSIARSKALFSQQQCQTSKNINYLWPLWKSHFIDNGLFNQYQKNSVNRNR